MRWWPRSVQRFLQPQRQLNETYEFIAEDAALEWFGSLGYAIGHGPHLLIEEPAAARDSFGDVLAVRRVREAIRRLNPATPGATQATIR